MKKNVGTIDRTIRGLVGIALIAAFALGAVSGSLGIVALVIGIAMLATAAMGYCMPYSWLGIDTCAKKQDPKPSA
jgi:hypothetical protein